MEPPLYLEGLPLHIVKTANATLGHYGEFKAAPLTLDRAPCMPTFAACIRFDHTGEMAGGQSWVF